MKKRFSRYHRAFKRKPNQRRIALVLSILLFAGVGAYVLIQSHAAASTAVVEPEDGLLTGPVSIVSNANAGGGLFVRFEEFAGGGSGNWPANNIKDTLGFYAPGSITNRENWLGRPVNYRTMFVGRGQDKTTGLNTFRDAVSNNGNRTVVMSMPLGFDPGRGCTGMTPQFKAGVLDTITNGGDDGFWKAVAQHIKTNKLYEKFPDGRPKLIMRLGWESNGKWYCWSTVEGNAPKFISAYRYVHDLVEAEVGHKLTWVYGLNAGAGSPIEAARNGYPGDNYIDIVEFDVYDNSVKYWQNNNTQSPDMSKWPAAWEEKRVPMENIINEPKWSSKLIAVGEWATNITLNNSTGQVDKSHGGGGDNPAWITAIHDLLKPLAESRRLAYNNYFDGEDNVGAVKHYHSLSTGDTKFPNSATRFRNLFR